MPRREPGRRTDWRRRREEYLRASGHRDALIAEGYESAGLREWVVIRGGRRGRPNPVKGARWAYDVDYESIFQLGAKKPAEQERDARTNRKRKRAT